MPKAIAMLMLISLTFGAGLEVNREHLIAAVKNVWLLARALLANIIIVPIIGVILVKLFQLPPPVATGFLLMAIAPGVPLVLSGARKRGGSLGFAVELAAVLPLVSIVTVPLTAALVFPSEANAHLSTGRFIITLVFFQLLPLLIGIVVGGQLPAAAPRLARISRIVFFLTLLALLIALFPKLVSSVSAVYGSHGMWAMLCITILAMVTGWLLGGPAREDRRILGIATALRNIGLASLIATANFPNPLVGATVLVYLLIQAIVVTAEGVYFTRTAKEAAA
ncbi:MAG TPA: bile acid:sodium symporter [Candidatus Cybelea sp.]|jgi:BASS family bile acid:Na+ symporter